MTRRETSRRKATYVSPRAYDEMRLPLECRLMMRIPRRGECRPRRLTRLRSQNTARALNSSNAPWRRVANLFPPAIAPYASSFHADTTLIFCFCGGDRRNRECGRHSRGNTATILFHGTTTEFHHCHFNIANSACRRGDYRCQSISDSRRSVA